MKTQQQRQEVPTVAHAQATGWSTHSTAQYTAHTECTVRGQSFRSGGGREDAVLLLWLNKI